MKSIDSMIGEVCDAIIKEAGFLVAMTGKLCVTSREIQTAVRLTVPKELGKHAVAEGTKAVTKFTMGGSGPKSQRAGLQFPVSHFRNVIKAKTHLRVGSGAPVYLAAVLEYLSAEILELSGNAAKDNRNARVTPRHLLLAIRGDEELDGLFKGTIPMGGVIPFIHVALIGKH
jgi:histone H2A